MDCVYFKELSPEQRQTQPSNLLNSQPSPALRESKNYSQSRFCPSGQGSGKAVLKTNSRRIEHSLPPFDRALQMPPF